MCCAGRMVCFALSVAATAPPLRLLPALPWWKSSPFGILCIHKVAMANLKDVARHAGVSISSASRVLREEGYTTDLVGAEAARFIRAAPAGEPWLLYVPFNAPHGPFQAKEEDLKKYAHVQEGTPRIYAAMVDSMDQAIGRILAAVGVRKRADAAEVEFGVCLGG